MFEVAAVLGGSRARPWAPFPAANVLADPTLCLSDGSDPCSGFNGIYLPNVHPGFIFVQGAEVGLEGVFAHEWSHVFTRRFLRETPFGRFDEPFANTLAAAITAQAKLGVPGWLVGLPPGLGAESLDYNGTAMIADDLAEQPVLRPFFPSSLEAAAMAGSYTSQNGIPCSDPQAFPTPEARGDCVMSQRGGHVWRVMYDLHDGGAATPEPEWWFQRPGGGILKMTPGFDGVDGGGSAEDAGSHGFIGAVLGYLGGKHAPENPAYSDRGQTDLDLVDTLDAMMCRGVMTEEDAKQLLRDVHGYAYDFNPPGFGGACP